MYAITGITGKVGGVVARTLLAAGLPVRAVARDEDKGRPWAAKGCEVAIASIADADGLTKAFSGADGVFLMTPPDFDPEPGFPITHEAIKSIKTAIAAAQPAKVVFLSTVGAQVRGHRHHACRLKGSIMQKSTAVNLRALAALIALMALVVMNGMVRVADPIVARAATALPEAMERSGGDTAT